MRGERLQLTSYRSHPSLFFFFQAEDGIRDPLVTGVQTCALPIYLQRVPPVLHGQAARARHRRPGREVPAEVREGAGQEGRQVATSPAPARVPGTGTEIGRASCRERVRGGEGAGT